MTSLAMTSSEVTERIARSMPFVRAPEEIGLICRIGEIKECPAGTLIQRYGEMPSGQWILLSGVLEASFSTAGGKRILRDFIFPGQATDPTCIIDMLPAPFSIVTRSACTLVFLPLQPLKKLMDAMPSLVHEFARQMCFLRRATFSRQRAGMCLSTRGFIVRLLLYWSRDQITSAMRPYELPVTLKQDDIAAMAGLSRATVNKELTRLAEEGILDIHYRGLTVLASAKLCAIAMEEEPFDAFEQSLYDEVFSANAAGSGNSLAI